MKKRFSLSVREVPPVIKEGLKYNSPLFYAKYVPKTENIKFAFVISKKVYKKAVDRNKLKRRVKEAFRNNKKLFPNFYCVVFPSASARDIDFKNLLEEVKKFASSLTK